MLNLGQSFRVGRLLNQITKGERVLPNRFGVRSHVIGYSLWAGNTFLLWAASKARLERKAKHVRKYIIERSRHHEQRTGSHKSGARSNRHEHRNAQDIDVEST